MRVLLDECLPRRVRRLLPGHAVRTVAEAGWAGIKNGALLRLAEQDFDVFLTVDKNLPFQQNLAALHLGVIVLETPDNKVETLEPLMTDVLNVLGSIQPGQVVRITA
jgi:predicted nuclease of predicted toxin-antitoxin system